MPKIKSTMVIYVNPLNQRIIWEDMRKGYEGHSCLDKLNTELRYLKTEYIHKGTVEEMYEYAVENTRFKESQWIRIETERSFRMEDVWKQAMKSLRQSI